MLQNDSLYKRSDTKRLVEFTKLSHDSFKSFMD